MISPTIGRVVLFHPANPHDQPFPALVAYVHSDRMVNLAVFDSNGNPFGKTSVQLLQDGDPTPDWCYCEWMPFQKGQAAKYDALLAAKA
jgi:hypothetical protein